MAKKPEYIKFIEEDNGSLKTRRVTVRTVSSNVELGRIFWYSPWRQYVFNPTIGADLIFNPDCMNEISSYTHAMTRGHREALQQAKVQT